MADGLGGGAGPAGAESARPRVLGRCLGMDRGAAALKNGQQLQPCFAEPNTHDPTPARADESRLAWLARSTWSRAVATRAFYNSNLAALPPEIAQHLCTELRRDRSEAKYFELVVGRFLQILGAERLDYEVPGSEGRRVDWTAQFA